MSWIFEKFNKAMHDRDSFDCGIPELNDYLKYKISPDLKRNFGRAVVAIMPENIQKKLPRYPVPVARIGRLAVDKSFQGQGLGEELLIHALQSVANVSETVGVYAVVVDAKNEKSEKFYKRYGFLNLNSKEEILSLFLPMKTIELLFNKK